MTTTKDRPILITGAHRSGSTWVGHMLALSPFLGYIHEPFNPRREPGICSAKFDFWFMHICDENGSFYENDIQNCLHFKGYFLEKLGTSGSLENWKHLCRNFLRFAMFRTLQKRALVKDPIAIFSAEWLAKRFNMDVVVMIRNPAAFVGSLKKAGWTFDFNQFLQQPLLMEHYFSKYESKIREYATDGKDIIDQAILLWNLIYHVVLIYQKEYPDWIFVRHEDLSNSPSKEFCLLYDKLGLDFSVDIEQQILSCSSTESSIGKGSVVQRDSSSNIYSWQARLSDDEICRVKRDTFEIACEFYPEEEWMKRRQNL
ncbi:MAG: sulfotransferase [Anaerolineae bacterium]|nr:sulfotransferase [Gloeobacterales cyanobacterium ES-bin-313]